MNGSSPLTRGKPYQLLADDGIPGLIPAHAGKTRIWVRFQVSQAAHPRSRGENRDEPQLIQCDLGSSPLTRGKLPSRLAPPYSVGLIPAHAGKTPEHVVTRPCAWAHPRSRGENPSTSGKAVQDGGSSPLTRGKRRAGRGQSRCARLIPAHAGKTDQHEVQTRQRAAHPRSRGENVA